MDSQKIPIPAAYEVEEEHFSKDLNSELVLLTHKKTKAKVALISNSDENKVFYIGFRTPVDDSTGVPHIIEHTVLCGSDKYPIKDPFVELAKGSLNTFLNAMTFPDKTVYPVASCNDKDFRNLMDVYLDAVFHPNIYKHKEIFEQEGWHYELPDPDGDLTLNGVVYSEMKGAFSSPDDVMERQVMNSLFPDITYGMESGGDPEVIPTLTYEAFLDFHRRYYHPSNSYIYLYGNMDMEENLNYIDREYLSEYEDQPVDSGIGLQKPFEAKREIAVNLPVLEEEDEGAYLTYNVVMGESVDRMLYNAIRILDYAICSAPGAPLKTALVNAGIGKDVYSTYENGIRQQFFSIVAKDAKESQKEEFLSVIRDVLTDIVTNGFQEKALRAAISRMEFSYREADFGSYPKGLAYGLQMLDSWLYDASKPFIHIEADETFKKLKENVNTGYFEGLVEKYLLNNPHGSVVVGVPTPGLAFKKEQERKEKLAALKASFSEERIRELCEHTKALKTYQETPDRAEDLARIPILEKEDLRRAITPLTIREELLDGSRIICHDLFTNGIAYLTVSFDASGVPHRLYPHLALLKNCFGLMDTASYTYGDLFCEVDLYTGMIASELSVIRPIEGDLPKLYLDVKSKVLYENVPKAFELMKEILYTTKTDDEKRFKEIIAEMRSRIESSFLIASHAVAMNRMNSYITPAGAMMDAISGLSFLRFLQNADDHFDDCKEELISGIREAARIVLRPENMQMSLISPAGTDEGMREGFLALKEGAYREELPLYERETWELKRLNEGFKTPGDVQFVCMGGIADRDRFPYTGALKVLKVILGYEYLWMNVRVKGGAYGCMSAFNRGGNGGFVSYRDPNLKETMEIFRGIPEYIRNFKADTKQMTKYIIGALSESDAPLSASAEGARSYLAYRSHLTEAILQKERDELLDCTENEIRALADDIEELLDCNAVCVVGTEGAIERNSEIFAHTESLL